MLLLSLPSLVQEKVAISWKMADKSIAEFLIGVSVYIKEIKSGATTNEYGFYSLTVAKGSYNINIDYIGYTAQNMPINLIESVNY